MNELKGSDHKYFQAANELWKTDAGFKDLAIETALQKFGPKYNINELRDACIEAYIKMDAVRTIPKTFLQALRYMMVKHQYQYNADTGSYRCVECNGLEQSGHTEDCKLNELIIQLPIVDSD